MSESGMPADVAIRARSARAFINLRLNPRGKQALEAVERVLGQPPPLSANTFTGGGHNVYWLGPDEWLVATGAQGASELASELAEALEGFHAAVNDVSGGYVELLASGADAGAVLAKGCPLDLHPREFAPGQCAQTGLGRAAVLLAAIDPSTYAVVVRRSFARYLRQWLENAVSAGAPSRAAAKRQPA